MRLGRPQVPPGRHVALAPGVLLLRAYVVRSTSVLDSAMHLPPIEVEPTQRSVEPPAWHEWALCNGMDQKRFFDEDRKSRVGAMKEARAICRACSVAGDCLLWALEMKEEFGIWAGSSGRQRAGMLERVKAGEATIELEVETWLRTR